MDSAPSMSSSIASDFSGIVVFAILQFILSCFVDTQNILRKKVKNMRGIFRRTRKIGKEHTKVVSFVRTIIMYSIVILVMRIMGKRQIGQLQPYEFVIAIMISDLATLPMQDSAIPLWTGIVPILSLLLLQLCISFSVLKSKKIRSFFCGKPCIMVKNGLIIEENLRNQMYTLDDLLEALRLKGFPDVKSVQLAILENNGELSVLPTSEAQEITRGDMNIKAPSDVVTDLIIGGCLLEDNMELLNIKMELLMSELHRYGLNKIEDVFYCYVNGAGKIVVQKKGRQAVDIKERI